MLGHEPVEAFLDDRRLFCDAVYSYYVDCEPEHAWVAAGEQGPVGFLVGPLAVTFLVAVVRMYRRDY